MEPHIRRAHSHRVNWLERVGAAKTMFGAIVLLVAVFVLFWPTEQTAWLTQWLYRLQEPIGTTGTPTHDDWHNVTVGLLLVLGGWTFVGGIGDVLESRARRVALLTQTSTSVVANRNSVA